MADLLDAPDLLQLRQFHRPLPVDRIGFSSGVAARAHLGVFHDTGRFYAPRGYRRTPWHVVRYKYKEFLGLLFSDAAPGGTGAPVNLSWPDDTNTARTVRCYQHAGTVGESYCHFVDVDVVQVRFKYGTGTTAPLNTDFNIQTQAGATFDASSVSYDDALFKVRTRGTRLHTEAGVTVNEVAQFHRYEDTADVLRQFLVDHSAVSPGLVLATNQTLAIVYDWQF